MIKKICKNCKFYESSLGYKYGDCNKVAEMTEADLGLKGNPDRIYDPVTGWRNGDYIKPSYILDESSNVYLDTIIWHCGGNYDSMSVGENFGCIHFENK